MDQPGEGHEEGIGSSLNRTFSRLLDIVRTRADLFAVELRLERTRQLECIFLSIVLGGLVLLGVGVLSVAVVIRFWDEAPLAALSILGGFYLLGAAFLYLQLRRRMVRHQPFRHTLEELKKDKSCLEDPTSEN
jgi:uncharacterized membrane protein YqjE